jgi:tryptophan synthase beta chain
MAAYDAYFAGKLDNYAYPGAAIEESLGRLPKVEG